MNGLYRMFLGDARPNAMNDEWVFSDVDSIQEIIIPAARIALKVHQVKGRQTLKCIIIESWLQNFLSCISVSSTAV
jgi:hypothetical protein